MRIRPLTHIILKLNVPIISFTNRTMGHIPLIVVMNIKYVKKPFAILQQGPTHSSSGSCLELYRKQSSLDKKSLVNCSK